MVLCTMGAGVAHGEDLTTTEGKTFHDVQVLSRSSSALLIQSREGEYQFSFPNSSPVIARNFQKT